MSKWSRNVPHVSGWGSHVLCTLGYSQACFLSEEIHFSDMKSKWVWLSGYFISEASVAETIPAWTLYPVLPCVSALSSDISTLLGSPAWFLRKHGNPLIELHHSLLFAGLRYVGIYQRPEKPSSVPKVLQPTYCSFLAWRFMVFLWLVWRAGNPCIAVEWMNQAPTFCCN